MDTIRAAWKNSAIEEKLLWMYVILLPLINLPLCVLFNKKVLFTDIIAVLLLITYLIKYVSKMTKFIPSYTELSLLIMISLFSISCLNSISILNSFIELFSILYLMTLFILIFNIVTTKEKLVNILYIWTATTIIISLIGLAAFYISIYTKKIEGNLFLNYSLIDSVAHHFPRICSTFIISNMFFSYLHVSFIFAVILFLLNSDIRKKVLLSIFIGIIIATSLMTGSRRYAGLLLSSMIIISLYGKGRLVSILKYALFSLFLLFLAAYIITSIWVVFPVKIAIDKADKVIDIRADYSYSLHFLSPLASVNMIKRHPIVGVGIGTYNKNFKNYIDWQYVKSSFGFRAYPDYIKLIEEKALSLDPHSLYLGIISETGMAGFIGILYFLYNLFRLYIIRYKQEPASEKIIGGCAVAGLVGFLLNGITMDIMSMRHFWFMMAIGIAGLKSKD